MPPVKKLLFIIQPQSNNPIDVHSLRTTKRIIYYKHNIFKKKILGFKNKIS